MYVLFIPDGQLEQVKVINAGAREGMNVRIVHGLLAGMKSNDVTVTQFLQLLMFWELEPSYFLSQIFTVVTVTEVTIAPKLLA